MAEDKHTDDRVEGCDSEKIKARCTDCIHFSLQIMKQEPLTLNTRMLYMRGRVSPGKNTFKYTLLIIFF